MARDSEAKRVGRWQERVTASNRQYDKWEKDYQVKRLEPYYLGKQWRGLSDTEADKLYVTNLVFPTIETQLPSLLFTRPQVRVEPRPSHQDDLGSQAPERAALLESTLQTIIDDPKLHFGEQTLLALRDSPFRFSVIEVGYTADFIDNPNAGRPALKGDTGEPMIGKDGEAVMEPAKILNPNNPTPESVYFKRIPPQNFRVSASGKNILPENDWVGYREWHYVEDVKANKKYRNTANLKATGTFKDATPADKSSDEEAERHNGQVCLWKIWDLRKKVRHVYAEGQSEKFLLEDEPWTVNPFAVLKFYEISDEFYPLPPVYNWLSPQDEINETREAMRNHRRRFVRKYTAKNGSIKQEELDKLNGGGDGTVAWSITEDPLKPVQDASLDPANTVQELAVTKDDFMQISGVGQAARGETEADTTATEANIVNTRLQIRETRQRVQVSNWLGEICRITLLTIREKMLLPFWIQIQSDPFAQDPQDAQRTVNAWQQITAEDLGDIDVDVKVDMASLSPVSEDQQRAQWSQVLALLSNPALMAILFQPNPSNPMEPSPLLRKTLSFYGIKSESEIREIMRVGMTVMAQQAQAAMMAQQTPGAIGGGKPPGQPAGLPAPGPMGLQ